VTNVSKNGFWLLLDDSEIFVGFKQFPWFRDATIGQLVNVERPAGHHLYWPDLDVDLAVKFLTHPERYPLVSRARPNKALQRAVSRESGSAGKHRGPAARSRR
jgi:hypothetical protein